MTPNRATGIAALLRQAPEGDLAAVDVLLSRVYGELHRLAHVMPHDLEYAMACLRPGPEHAATEL